MRETCGDHCQGMPMDLGQRCPRSVTACSITAGSNTTFCPTFPGKQRPLCMEVRPQEWNIRAVAATENKHRINEKFPVKILQRWYSLLSQGFWMNLRGRAMGWRRKRGGRSAAVNLAFIWRSWMGARSSTDGISIPPSLEENVFLIQ